MTLTQPDTPDQRRTDWICTHCGKRKAHDPLEASEEWWLLVAPVMARRRDERIRVINPFCGSRCLVLWTEERA